MNQPTMRKNAAFILVATALLVGGLALARSYTDADIKAMKRHYQPPPPPSRTASPPFPEEVLKEPYTPPVIVPRFLPYTEWRAEYEAYFQRHTGDATVELKPTILVMHYTATFSFDQAYRLFREGTEMSAGKGTTTVFGHPSVHFMIDRDGTIYQHLPTNHRATGAYGVNHVSLQVELVALNELDLLTNKALLVSSFRLARHLMREHRIPRAKVYGHYHVSQGVSAVPEYLDRADPDYPTSYPPRYARRDPGETYMAWLFRYLSSCMVP